MEEKWRIHLSPSRASEFKSCPQLFKFRRVDRLPEPVDPLAARGSLLHVVLESLFRLPAVERTRERAFGLLGGAWEEIRSAEAQQPLPLWASPFDDSWLSSAGELLANYFLVEDPSRVHTQQVEWSLELETEELVLRGIIDRLDVVEDGEWAITDYKTGASPPLTFALGSFYGLRFYALLVWRAFGKLPKTLRLIHLREPEVVTLQPTVSMLEGLERQLEALGVAMRRAWATGNWRPRPGYLCSWCPHRAICPAFAVKESKGANESPRTG